METLRVLLTQFTDESITLSLSLMALTGVAIIVYWVHHRRKMNQLAHQIPASVVKNYLDSIIQNSTALKSSLFRGGGLELGNGIPSVLPVTDLPKGNAHISSEELNQRKAEVSQLTMRLMEKERMVQDLEKQLQLASASAGASGDEQTAILKKEIVRLQKELEELRASKPAGGGNDAALKGQLAEVTKERDELKERLMEYEIIEEDLANLKRLQQENEQLKKALGGAAPAAPKAEAAPAPKPKAAAPAPAPEPEPEVEEEAEVAAMPIEEEEELSEPAAEEAEETVAAAPAPAEEEAPAEEAPKAGGEQKSAEELLSEFEKMLG